MKPLIRFLILGSLIVLAGAACTGSREVIGSESQPTSTSAAQEPVQATDPPAQAQPTNTTPAQTVTAAEVVDINSFTDSIDALHFIGLVRNTGTVDLEFVEITVTLRDANNTLVAVESGYTSLDVVPVGQVSPFSVLFLEAPAEWSTYEIDIQGEEADFLDPYTEFEVVSSTGRIPSFGGYEIVGEIRNTGVANAEFVEVIAVLYDVNNRILGVDFTFTEFDIVEAGGTSPFSLIALSTADGAIDHYDLFIEGSVAD